MTELVALGDHPRNDRLGPGRSPDPSVSRRPLGHLETCPLPVGVRVCETCTPSTTNQDHPSPLSGPVARCPIPVSYNGYRMRSSLSGLACSSRGLRALSFPGSREENTERLAPREKSVCKVAKAVKCWPACRAGTAPQAPWRCDDVTMLLRNAVFYRSI